MGTIGKQKLTGGSFLSSAACRRAHARCRFPTASIALILLRQDAMRCIYARKMSSCEDESMRQARLTMMNGMQPSRICMKLHCLSVHQCWLCYSQLTLNDIGSLRSRKSIIGKLNKAVLPSAAVQFTVSVIVPGTAMLSVTSPFDIASGPSSPRRK